MNKPNEKFHSLIGKGLVYTMLAAAIAVAAGTMLYITGTFLAEKIYYSEDNMTARKARYAADLQTYADAESMKSDDAVLLTKWLKKNKDIYSIIVSDGQNSHQYYNGVILPETAGESETLAAGTTAGSGGGIGTDTTAPFVTIPDVTGYNLALVDAATIRFADAVRQVTFLEDSDSLPYGFAITLSVSVSVLLFLILIFLYHHQQTRAILRLSADVRAASARGKTILPRSNDELGRLASDVEAMRQSVIRKNEEKQKAWQANSDLITSISHDIRTPLTTLLGYLDVLNENSGTLSPESQQQLRICADKVAQIKEMSDGLFQYFLAFNSAEREVETEEYDASMLLSQLITDHLPELSLAHLEVHLDTTQVFGTVRTNVDLLRRIIDNLFSNLLKYADPAEPILIVAETEEDRLRLTFCNRIRKQIEKKESTHIGVKNCKSLTEILQGDFSCMAKGNRYESELILPLIPAEKNGI